MNNHAEQHKIIKQSTVQALLSLMETKPFSEITITELIGKAGIARSTYYRNYSSKEEVLTAYIDDVLQDFYCEFPAKSMQERFEYEHIAHILDYVMRYKNQLSILHKSGLSSLYLNAMNRYFFGTLNSPTLSADDKFKVYAFAGAEFNIIFSWILGDTKESMEEITSYIRRRMRDTVFRF
jgi:AcrR family transcriptional regulator